MNVLPRRRHAAYPLAADEQYEIDCSVRRMFAMVADGIDSATGTLLSSDRDAARAIAERDRLVDDLQRSVERRVLDRLARRADLSPRQVRELVAVLRVVPELERSGDLCVHIATRGIGASAGLSSETRVLVQQIGWHATAMWRDAAAAYVERDPTMIVELRAADDHLDDLHDRLRVQVTVDAPSAERAMDLALVTRCFERLGDHAVNVTRRLEDLAAAPVALR